MDEKVRQMSWHFAAYCHSFAVKYATCNDKAPVLNNLIIKEWINYLHAT